MNNIRLLKMICSSVGLLILLSSISIANSYHPEEILDAPAEYYLSDLAPPATASQEVKQFKSNSANNEKSHGMQKNSDDLNFLILCAKILIATGFGVLAITLLTRLAESSFGNRK